MKKGQGVASNLRTSILIKEDYIQQLKQLQITFSYAIISYYYSYITNQQTMNLQLRQGDPVVKDRQSFVNFGYY